MSGAPQLITRITAFEVSFSALSAFSTRYEAAHRYNGTTFLSDMVP
jgi:hypothetical protein